MFDLGQKYGKDFDLSFVNREGKKQHAIVGCYGVGISRLMGVIVEALADEKGMVWPGSVAPFSLHLVNAMPNDAEAVQYADELYDLLTARGVAVLYDDRDIRAGEKFADSDLIGIPSRVVVGKEALAGNSLELVNRASGEVERYTREELFQRYEGTSQA